MVTSDEHISPPSPHATRVSFAGDFKRFFFGGLAALLPTLITLWLLVWVWSFLWEVLGRQIVWSIRRLWETMAGWWIIPADAGSAIDRYWGYDDWHSRVIGVLLAIVLVYIVGVFVGNLIGRTVWRLIEVAVMRIPLVRAIYPAVKQVTDFVLAERHGQFQASRVVAVQPHEQGIWSIGLVTGGGVSSLSRQVGKPMVTVFVPSSPTAFSGYVLVVPTESVVELPLTVEEAMRLLVSGGVLAADTEIGGQKSEVRDQKSEVGNEI